MKVLNIRSQQPQIGMQTTKGKLEMDAPQAELDIKNAKVDIKLNTTSDKLEIDQYPSRASYGVISIADSSLQESRKAQQKAQEGIAKIVQEGNQFFRKSASKVIARREKSKLFARQVEMKVQLCQVAAPSIKYTPGTIEIKPELRPVKLKVDKKEVDFTYTPAKVNIYLKQKGEVRMWVSEKYDIYA